MARGFVDDQLDELGCDFETTELGVEKRYYHANERLDDVKKEIRELKDQLDAIDAKL